MKGDLSQEPDHVIVERIREGEEEVFDILIARYKDSLFKFIYYNLPQREEAEDIAQESFLKAFLALPRLRNPRRFKTWLFSIALNLVRDHKREFKRKPSLPLEDLPGNLEPTALDDPSDDVENEDLLKRVREGIERLPSKLREVLILYDMQGFSYEEIASIVHCPLGTVKSRLFKARQMLREMLSPYIEGDEDEL